MKTLNSCVSGNFRAFMLVLALACLAALTGCTKESSVSSSEMITPVSATVERFDKKLCDPENNPYHATAKKLFKRHQQTKNGLDEYRYSMTYAYVITVDRMSFHWETYHASHRSDVVMYYDTADRVYKIFTNRIDTTVFRIEHPIPDMTMTTQ